MKRIEALQQIVACTPEVPVVATCAATSRELSAVADRDNHLYLLDSMGLTTSVGTGLALAVEGSEVAKVVVVDGDGSLLMNLGALATAGYLQPARLLVLLLDNGVYASTAGLATQAEQVDLGAVADACGLRVRRESTVEGLGQALTAELRAPDAGFVHVSIEPGNEPGTPLLLIDPAVHAARFTSWLTARTAR